MPTGALVPIAFAIVLLADTALAQEGWSRSVGTLATQGVASSPSVHVDAQGNAIAEWTERRSLTTEAFVVAHYVRESDAWGPPIDLPGRRGLVAVDGAGDATALLVSDAPANKFALSLVRYTAVQRTWSSPTAVVQLPAGQTPALAVNARGDALAVWVGPVPAAVTHALYGIRYSTATGTWGAVQVVAPASDALGSIDVVSPRVVLGVAGDALVAWTRTAGATERVQGASSSAASTTWTAPAEISGTRARARVTGLDTDGDGNGVVLWEGAGVEASTFDHLSGIWGQAALIDGATGTSQSSLAVAAGGDVAVAWVGDAGNATVARKPPGANAWSQPSVLSSPGAIAPAVALDAAANLVVVWRSSATPSLSSAVVGVRFVASKGGAIDAPAVTLSLPGSNTAGTYGVSDGPAVGISAGGDVTVLWGHYDTTGARLDATRWRATVRPPTVTAITPTDGGVTIGFSVQANDVTFAPTSIEYSLDDGATWSSRQPLSPISPLVVTGLAIGADYQVRLRAVNRAGAGRASAMQSVRAAAGPNAPTGLVVKNVAKTVVTLGWDAPFPGGAEPVGYVLEGGTRPGEVLARLPTSPFGRTITVDVPNGIYFVRVRAVGLVGATAVESPPSAERRIVVGPLETPSPPVGLFAVADAHEIDINWRNTFDGGPATSLRLSVTGAVVGQLDVPLSESLHFSGVPVGTYGLTMTAVNAAGASLPSAPFTLNVTGLCIGVGNTRRPHAPTDFQATLSGNLLTLTWKPPVTGPIVRHYELGVTGAFTGTISAAAPPLSGRPGPGTYTISVYARNECGYSPPAGPVTVVVP